MNLISMLNLASYKVKKRKPKAAPIRDGVVSYIATHPGCTMRMVQEATGLTDRAIASWMHRLHRDGMITRQSFSVTKYGGRPKYSFWVVD